MRHNWFELWYQPKIELRTMHLVGAEALVRARHPVRGIVPPFLFLPGASEQDMHALTEQVILTALAAKSSQSGTLREARPLEVTEDQIIHDLDLAGSSNAISRWTISAPAIPPLSA